MGSSFPHSTKENLWCPQGTHQLPRAEQVSHSQTLPSPQDLEPPLEDEKIQVRNGTRLVDGLLSHTT